MNCTAKIRTHPLPQPELFSLFEEVLGGSRPPCLGEPPGPQDRVQRHTVEQLAEFAPVVQILDVPVPLVTLGEMQDRILQQLEEQTFVDNTEQVIAVPKISSPAGPAFRGRLQLVHTRRVEQLLAVPVPSPRDCVIARTLGEEEEEVGTVVAHWYEMMASGFQCTGPHGVYWWLWGTNHEQWELPVGGNHRQPRAVLKYWARLR